MYYEYLCFCHGPGKKKDLWDSIQGAIDQFRDQCICVVWDFNAIRRVGERVGRSDSTDNRVMTDFECFINQGNLVELPLICKSFTCYRPDKTCKNKLDRMLVNDEWIEKWPA